jgi:hypothetical protein
VPPASFDAIVAGHLCLDVFPDLSASPRDKFLKSFIPGRLVK